MEFCEINNDPIRLNLFVEQNIPLVHYIIHKLNVPDYDDCVQEGCIALVKAVKTFNESKGIKFATYASRIIYNEVFMHFRKGKKHQKNISLDGLISESENLTVLDTLSDGKDMEEDILESLLTNSKLKELFNILDDRDKKIIQSIMNEKTQRQAADSVGLSQAYVSRLIKKMKKKYKDLENKQITIQKKEKIIQNKKGEDNTMNNDHLKCIDVIKEWIKANPNTIIPVRKVVNQAGLTVTPGYETALKNKAFQQLKAEGFNFENISKYNRANKTDIKENKTECVTENKVEIINNTEDKTEICSNVSNLGKFEFEDYVNKNSIDSICQLLRRMQDIADFNDGKFKIRIVAGVEASSIHNKAI